MLVYLDNCCFNRPYDDQTDIIIRLETEAKLFVQELVKNRKVDLVWSFILDYENSKNLYNDKQEQISAWRDFAKSDILLTDTIKLYAAKFMSAGLKQMDAAHLACAVCAGADFFLTTDKKILNKTIAEIKIVNPIKFVEVYINDI